MPKVISAAVALFFMFHLDAICLLNLLTARILSLRRYFRWRFFYLFYSNMGLEKQSRFNFPFQATLPHFTWD